MTYDLRMSSSSGRRPWLKVVFGVACLVAIVAAVAYAVAPSAKVADAGQAPGYTPPTAAPVQTESLWIGDSYTEGTGAGDGKSGEACLTAAALDWSCEMDAEGGTGFVNDGHDNVATYQPLPARLATDAAKYPRADVVIIDAGRNDASLSVPKVEAAASKYLTDVRAAFPKARLVLIVPYYMTSKAEFGPLGDLYRSRAKALHAQVIDPIGEGWIGSASTDLVIADKIHPNPAGHVYIAKHLAADLKAAS